MNNDNEIDLIVSGREDSADAVTIAGAIASILRRDDYCVLQGIGPNAVNKAVKAIIIAEGYLNPSGVRIATQMCFRTLQIDGSERTAIRFVCSSEKKG